MSAVLYEKMKKSRSGMKKTSNHRAKSPWQWRQRLVEFATGVRFKRGEAPPKDTYWAQIAQEMVECPAHGGSYGACVCEYHRLVS